MKNAVIIKSGKQFEIAEVVMVCKFDGQPFYKLADGRFVEVSKCLGEQREIK